MREPGAWRRVAAVVTAGVVTAGLLWFVGVATGFALAVSALVMVAIVVIQAFAGIDAPEWDGEPARTRPGARSDIVKLSWAMRHVRGEVSDAGLKRTRAFAASRLARLGYDLDAPDDVALLVDLLGAEAFGILNDPHSHVRLPAVERALDRLDRLPASSEGHRHHRESTSERHA